MITPPQPVNCRCTTVPLPPPVQRLLRVKRAVAGVLGCRCYFCGRLGRWAWDLVAAVRFPRRPLLTVEHRDGRPYSIRRLNTASRWPRYLREAVRGLLEAACWDCNRKHGGARRYKRRRPAPRGGR